MNNVRRIFLSLIAMLFSCDQEKRVSQAIHSAGFAGLYLSETNGFEDSLINIHTNGTFDGENFPKLLFALTSGADEVVSVTGNWVLTTGKEPTLSLEFEYNQTKHIHSLDVFGTNSQPKIRAILGDPDSSRYLIYSRSQAN